MAESLAMKKNLACSEKEVPTLLIHRWGIKPTVAVNLSADKHKTGAHSPISVMQKHLRHTYD